MKIKKTPQAKRGTYKLFDDSDRFVTEYKPGENGVTEVDILNLHKLDDHEVYLNAKENRLPEWYQPIFDKWKAEFITDFREKHGREPFADEVPGRHRVLESLDGQTDPDGDDLGDSSCLYRMRKKSRTRSSVCESLWQQCRSSGRRFTGLCLWKGCPK